MGSYIWIIVIIGIAVIWGIISWIIETTRNSKKYIELKPKLDNLERSITEHDAKVGKDREMWKAKVEKWNTKIINDKAEIKIIANQKSMGFPWLADAYANYFALKERELGTYLRTKRHPAHKSADIVEEIRNENKTLRTENETVKYKINYLETLFPWLKEFLTEDKNQEILTSTKETELVNIIRNSKSYQSLKAELETLEKNKKEHETKVAEEKKEHEIKIAKDKKEHETKVTKDKIEHESDIATFDAKIEKTKLELEKIAKQKSMGFPWLAEAYADYFALKDGKIENHLRHKSHPALTAAENVKRIKQEKRELLKENKLVNYKITYLEKLFPWLSELIAEDEAEEIPVRIDDDEIEEDNEDRVKNFLTQEEYKSLPSAERNQMALDRYLQNRNKSNWAIGRDYEMHVGHLYKQNGYSIEYKGILDGFEDLGRDVIAKKGDEVCIIQCKRWAQHKEIHEKHIFQLFGTTMEYWLNNYKDVKNQLNLFTNNLSKKIPEKSFEEFSEFLNENKLRPIFFTSTNLSKKAKEMADALSVEIRENEPPGEFPRIKCNINSDESGKETKIYHLPMDQQYDRTIIGNHPGEFYAFTVKEAEDAGFRRAFKHRFSK